MTARTRSGPDGKLAARPPYPTIMGAAVRVVASATVLVTAYYLLPLDRFSTRVAILAIGLLLFLGLVAYQVRSVIRSPFPSVRAVEALAISVPLFVLLFSSTYVVMATISVSNFGGRLTHTDGLYFAVTVLSTVGFGDITAKSQVARLVVTGQMISDLVILGLSIKIIVGAVSRARQPGDSGGGSTGRATSG